MKYYRENKLSKQEINKSSIRIWFILKLVSLPTLVGQVEVKVAVIQHEARSDAKAHITLGAFITRLVPRFRNGDKSLSASEFPLRRTTHNTATSGISLGAPRSALHVTWKVSTFQASQLADTVTSVATWCDGFTRRDVDGRQQLLHVLTSENYISLLASCSIV